MKEVACRKVESAKASDSHYLVDPQLGTKNSPWGLPQAPQFGKWLQCIPRHYAHRQALAIKRPRLEIRMSARSRLRTAGQASPRLSHHVKQLLHLRLVSIHVMRQRNVQSPQRNA